MNAIFDDRSSQSKNECSNERNSALGVVFEWSRRWRLLINDDFPDFEVPIIRIFKGSRID